MVGGVNVTILMDCCHSGTVMDLPYKFGADDTEVTREAGFNMEKSECAVKARDDRLEEQSQAPQSRPKKDEDDDEDDDKKSKKKKVPRKTRKMTEEEKERQKNIVVGPKIGADGVPALPVRKAVNRPAPPPDKKKCSVM